MMRIERVMNLLQSNICAARALLCFETPLNSDCGRYCDAACCHADDDGNGGMLLFPGEEHLLCLETCHATSDMKMMPDGEYGCILTCDGHCEREARPLGCMIFPLTPYYSDNAIEVRMDARAKPLCPLAAGGMSGVRSGFVDAVQAVMRMIASDDEGAAFIRRWQKLEEMYRFIL